MNFKLYYQNVRGIKSKIDSLIELVDDFDPTIICLVETHLLKEEEIKIEGYSTIFRNDNTVNSGGILIAVKDNIKTVTLEVEQEQEVGQSIWVVINNNKSIIRIGTIYGPQENKTKNSDLKIMYKNIAKQIHKAKENQEQVLLLGDFNAKVGKEIEDNKETVTKGGRQLPQLLRSNNLEMINKNKEKCKGLWTRVQEKEESILD